MVSNRYHRAAGYEICGILAGLLFLLIPCTGAWSQGKAPQAEDTRQRNAVKELQVVVQEGRLSVDVQEADLGQVLAQIGRQANIRMVAGPSAGKRVSARFAGVELEDGLRRLLRQASLNYILLHAQGPTGAVVIAEVRVLGAGQDASPGQSTVTEPGSQEKEQNPGPPVRKARGQSSGVVEPVQEPTPDPGQAEPTEVTRRVREVFKLGKEMGRKLSDSPESSPHESTQ
jgi:hypothetical protein